MRCPHFAYATLTNTKDADTGDMVSAPLLYTCKLRAAMRPLTPHCTRQRFPDTRNMHIIPPKEKSPIRSISRHPSASPRTAASRRRCLPVSNKRNCKSSHCAYAHATLAHTQHHLQALQPPTHTFPKIQKSPCVGQKKPRSPLGCGVCKLCPVFNLWAARAF